MDWLRILANILVIGGVGYGIYYGYQNEYFRWSTIKESFSFDGIKDTVLLIFSDPMFIFLYLIFVFVPVWVLTEWLSMGSIPLYQKIVLSIGGIWAVNQVMIGKGLR